MKIMETVKQRAIDVKEFVNDHYEIIAGVVSVTLVTGFSSGVQFGRNEWDFGHEDGKWYALMEDNGEFRTVLPGSAIGELLENHKVQPITNDFWKNSKG